MAHKIITEQLDAARDEYDARRRALQAAQRILDQTGLTPLLDRCLRFHVHEDGGSMSLVTSTSSSMAASTSKIVAVREPIGACPRLSLTWSTNGHEEA